MIHLTAALDEFSADESEKEKEHLDIQSYVDTMLSDVCHEYFVCAMRIMLI